MANWNDLVDVQVLKLLRLFHLCELLSQKLQLLGMVVVSFHHEGFKLVVHGDSVIEPQLYLSFEVIDLLIEFTNVLLVFLPSELLPASHLL